MRKSIREWINRKGWQEQPAVEKPLCRWQNMCDPRGQRAAHPTFQAACGPGKAPSLKERKTHLPLLNPGASRGSQPSPKPAGALPSPH